MFQSVLSDLIQKYFERYGNLMAIVRCVSFCFRQLASAPTAVPPLPDPWRPS